MKKLAFFTMAICGLLLAAPVFAQEQSAPTNAPKQECKRPTYVAALKQFKWFKVPDHDQVLATIVDHGPTVTDESGGATLEVEFVTEECEELHFTISFYSEFVEVWRHELIPFSGKYQYWHPILTIPRKKDGSIVYWYEIETEGRFFVQYSWDKENYGDVTGYLFENFRKPELGQYEK